MTSPLSSGALRLQSLIRVQERAQAPLLLAASLTAALVSAAAVLLLGLSGWFITAAALAGLAGPLVAQTFNYLVPSALIRFLAIIRTASRYGERMTGHNAALSALAALRPQLFEGLARGPVERTLRLSGGEAASRLMQDVDAIQNHFVRRSAPWGALSGLMAGLGMALIAGWKPAVVVVVATILGMTLCALIAQRFATPAGRRVQEASGQLKAEFAAMAAAAPELQAYGARDWAIQQVAHHGQGLDRANRQLALAGSAIACTQSAAMALGVAGVILTGPLHAPPLMALALLAAVTTIESSGTLMNALRQAGAVSSAVERLGELLEQAKTGTARPTGDDLSLTAAGLKLSPPQRLAITGRSGSGKTSLIERWMHLRAPIEGEAMLGVQDLTQLDPSKARARFAYAPQQAILLAGSLRANLRLADPKASDQDLWQALERAQLAERFRASPKGLDSLLGENGTRLSGGERRRLGLARAYLRQAPWLVLDEPTEGLDAETEARVLSGLEIHLATTGQGLILISHRPAPLALCPHQIEVQGLCASGAVQFAPAPCTAAA